MKLKDYIAEYGIDNSCKILQRADLLEGYFGNSMPEGFEANPYKDWILEALVSHDKKELQKQLRKEFGITDFTNANERESSRNAFEFTYEAEWSDEIDELKKVLDFYGWYITIQRGECFIVAPKWAENRTEYIRKDCKGFAYHICKNEDLPSILKSGLRCKNGGRFDYGYREFPNRVYLIASPPKDVRNVVKDAVKNELRKFGAYGDYSIIKVKVVGDVYQDDIMKSPNAFYTYTNIPANHIINSWPLDDFLFPERIMAKFSF